MFSRGALSTAVFVIVMYLGVLNRKIPGYTKLKGIRGEISIIGSILALGHNIYYGIYYFVHIFTNPQELELPYLIATIISLILILIMLPLMITSFLCVRRRMEAKKWKKLQTLAYPFYFLLYVHIMIVLVSNIRGTVTIVNIIVYSVVFLSYFMLLGNKLLKKRKVVIH